MPSNLFVYTIATHKNTIEVILIEEASEDIHRQQSLCTCMLWRHGSIVLLRLYLPFLSSLGPAKRLQLASSTFGLELDDVLCKMLTRQKVRPLFAFILDNESMPALYTSRLGLVFLVVVGLVKKLLTWNFSVLT